jgi:Polyketide cyclase / dehydrase and lipid transport
VASLTFSDSVVIASSPEELYGMVSDLTRMGEWSPVCRGCTWDEGAGPTVGSWFTGHNETPDRVWDTRSQVTEADPGRAFAWAVNRGWARWGYTFEAGPEGTTVTESWELTDLGQAGIAERFGDDGAHQIQLRVDAAHSGIPATLAALKRTAESD